MAGALIKSSMARAWVAADQSSTDAKCAYGHWAWLSGTGGASGWAWLSGAGGASGWAWLSGTGGASGWA